MAVRTEIIRFLILRTIGNFCVLFALFGVVATFGPALYYEVQYRIVQFRGVHYTVAEQKAVVPSRVSPTPMASELGSALGPQEQILVPKDPNFSLLVPKLGANSKVFPNVDPANENEFLPVLQAGVAHAKGSVFPGFAGNIYLFAHSSDNFWDVGRYNAVFYLLKDLSVGDDVVVFFENRRHDYVVFDSRIVDASDVSYLVNSQQPGKEVLILQTCWPPGTTWKRLLVLARPK